MEIDTRNKLKANKNGGGLECEDAIMRDKERFGRVRTELMNQLRSQYGKEVANRALFRINKRVSQNSLRIKKHLSLNNYEEIK